MNIFLILILSVTSKYVCIISVILMTDFIKSGGLSSGSNKFYLYTEQMNP